MDREKIEEYLGDLFGELNDALGTAQWVEEEGKGDEQFVKLRAMVEEALDYCESLLNSLG